MLIGHGKSTELIVLKPIYDVARPEYGIWLTSLIQYSVFYLGFRRGMAPAIIKGTL